MQLNQPQSCFVVPSAKRHIGQARLWVKLILPLSVCLLASGCSLFSGGSGLESDDTVTGSINPQIEAQGIDNGDADVIRAVVGAAEKPQPSHVLAWHNPETGSHGSVSAITPFEGSHGQDCRNFKATVNSFTGAAVFAGETCQASRAGWVLSWFAEDGN